MFYPRQLGLIRYLFPSHHFSEGKNVTMTSLKALLVWIFFFFSSNALQRPVRSQFLLDHWYFIASAGMWLHRAAVGHFLQDRPAREGLNFFDARLTFFLGICEMATDPDPPNSGLGLLATSSQAWVFSKNRSLQVECHC